MKKLSVIAVLVLAFAAAATSAQAKEGFYLGANLLFNDISGDINPNNTYDSGNGLGLTGGYGLNRYLAFEIGLWKTKHDTVGGTTTDLKAGTIDLKINFPLTGSQIEPYVKAGVGSYTLENSGRSIDGTGGEIGVGMDMYLFPELSLGAGLTRRNITFDTPVKNTDGTVTTLDVGLTYHFI